ncbi:histidine phosphatase family protein [Paenibacillus polymyxa]|uniref:histidine phosphatase family protein n=1 Tax=Paenibacillus polymyxa TaxID=1406 RepID=UPI00234BB787|nr:histidine phosphatase family protein [Paenibacillus polymyxa]WCM63156.1 histidine phosphatase family protein [Paenibacillus polymyxa]
MSLSTANVSKPSTEQVQRLQKGGYILYFRHAEPFPRSGDSELSEIGEEQATALGNFFREQNIPVQLPVVTSSARRAQQTGKAAFQNIYVEEALYDMDTLFRENPTEEEQARQNRLLTLLESNPAEGFNKVLIAHQFTFNGKVDPIPYLGMIMLMPKGEPEGYEVVDVFHF